MRILGVLLLALLAQQRPAGPATSSVKGVVVKLGTTEPVANAVVELVNDNRSSQPMAAATGTDGRFEFRNLEPGTYQLTASRSGYLSTAFGQRGPSGSGRNLTIEAGVNVDDIRLLMTATGAVSGRVFDNTGEPLANVPVHALQYSYADGQRTLNLVKVDDTNDLGEFRLFWLPPGQYILSAQPRDPRPGDAFLTTSDGGGPRTMFSIDPSGMVRRGNETGSPMQKLGEAYVPASYPGTVEVGPAAEVRGIDFRLARVVTRRIRGTVVDSTTGQPNNQGNVQLVPRGDSNGAATATGGAGDDGKFEIAGVLPGSYFLVAYVRGGSPDDIKVMAGRTSVEVGGADLENLIVTLRPSVDIIGSVTVEGRGSLPPDAHPVFMLEGRRDAMAPALTQVYGSFNNETTQLEFNTVTEGDFRITTDNLPLGMYVKSIQFGPADALNGGLHIDSQTKDRIQVVLGTNAGTLEGVVLDKLRNPIVGATVALIPDPARRQRADLYQNATSDDAGKFQLKGIPPGDYSLLAWEDIKNGLWRDPEFLRRHEASGKPLRIPENGRETVEIVAIPFAF